MIYSNQNDYMRYLDFLDIEVLQRRISEFRALNFIRLSSKEISEHLNKVFLVVNERNQMYMNIIQTTGDYNKGDKFYRIRDIPDNDNEIPLQTIKSEKDLWAAPKKIVSMQRINNKNESILYTTPRFPNIAIEEKRIKDGQRFILIEYEAIDLVKVVLIGVKQEISGLTKEQKIKHTMITDFFRDEFIRDVGIGTEYLYKISVTIVKDYFDLPPEISSAWCYPSVFNKKVVNVGIRSEESRKLLKLNAFLVCTKKDTPEGMELFSEYRGVIEEGCVKYTKTSEYEYQNFFPKEGILEM